MKHLAKSICIISLVLSWGNAQAAIKLYHQTTAPATCVVGDAWIDTDGVASDRFHTCTATNTWTKNSGSFAVPVASASVSGTVKVGSRLTITDDGVLSADVQSGTGAVDSVNAKTGVVVITPDDLNDTSTTKKLVTTSEKNTWNAKQAALVAGTDYLAPNGSAANLINFPSALATDAEVSTAISGKANLSAFASQAAFLAAFGWLPTGTFDTTADATITGDWSFSSGLEASNISLNLGSLADLKIGNAQMVDDTKGNGDTNYLWSADKVFDQLATKQPLDSDLTLAAGATGSGNSKYFGTNSSGTAGFFDLPSGGSGTSGYVSLSAAPYSDASCTSGQYGYYGSTAYLCTGGYWTSKWSLADHSNPSPVTYSLTIDGTGWNGIDLVAVGGSTYTADGTKTGLSGTTSVTVTPGSGRTATVSGTGITGSSSPYSADMSTNRTMYVTFSDVASTNYSDDFNRANENPISAPWVQPSGTNPILLTGNAACGFDGDSFAAYNQTIPNDQFSQVYVQSLSSAGVVTRMTNGDNWYLLHPTSSTALSIEKKVAAQWSSVASITVSNISVGDTLRFEASGTTLTAKVNGSVVWSGTDTSLSSGGVGIWSNGPAYCVDNWTGGNL